MNIAQLWGAVSTFVGAHPIIMMLLWPFVTAAVTAKYREYSAAELAAMPWYEKYPAEAVNLAYAAGIDSSALLGWIKRRLPAAWFGAAMLMLVIGSTSACALLKSPAMDPVEKALADDACLAGAIASGASDPAAIARDCGVLAEWVVDRLREMKKQQARFAHLHDAGTDQ